MTTIITQRDINKRQRDFRQIGINEKEPPPKIIQTGAQRSGGGSAAIIYAEVIESPTWPIDGEGGQSYYTLRLTSDSTAAWSEETTYNTGDAVIGSDDLMYISLTDDNVGNNPVGDEVNWEQSEEIKVEYAEGFEDIAEFDIRDCSPYYMVGAVIPVKQKTVGETQRWYIDRTFTYTGLPEEATIRNDPATGITHAVFG
jgi:hypothetical protein